MKGLDEITLSNMTVRCIVGAYRSERMTPQFVKIDLSLFLDSRRASRSDRLLLTIDYSELNGEIQFLLESSRFNLLESAAEAVARYVLAPPLKGSRRPELCSASVRMTKLHPLNTGAVPVLKINRSREEMAFAVEERRFGEVDVVFETHHCGIYRLRVKPRGVIPTHVHRTMEEAEMVLGGGLLLQNEPAQRGIAHRWPKEFPHRYENYTDQEQTILCIDRPAFMPEDEILVDDPPGSLETLEAHRYYDPRSYHE